MFRAPVVAALYATFEKDPEDAKVFWDSVARGIGFHSEDAPAARLNALLRNSVVEGGSGYRGTRNSITGEAFYRSCINAWNKYRSQETIGTYIRPGSYKSRPKVK